MVPAAGGVGLGDHRGADAAGDERVDADAVGRQLQRGDAGEAAQRPLRRRVGAQLAVAGHAGGGGDVDDRAAFGRAHGRRRGADAEEGPRALTASMRSKPAALSSSSDALQWTAALLTSTSRWPKRATVAATAASPLRLVGDVERDGEGASRAELRVDLGRQRGGVVGEQVGDRHPRALGREQPRLRRALARARRR